MKHKIQAGFFFLFLLLAACSSQPNYLRQALRLSGDNRPEFERALEYYKKNPADSLKLKAAIFLIENMPGHYSYNNENWLNAYYDEIDKAVNPLYDNKTNKKFMEDISQKYAGDKVNDTILDIHLLKARHLVDHIERSFEFWKQGELDTQSFSREGRTDFYL